MWPRRPQVLFNAASVVLVSHFVGYLIKSGRTDAASHVFGMAVATATGALVLFALSPEADRDAEPAPRPKKHVYGLSAAESCDSTTKISEDTSLESDTGTRTIEPSWTGGGEATSTGKGHSDQGDTSEDDGSAGTVFETCLEKAVRVLKDVQDHTSDDR